MAGNIRTKNFYVEDGNVYDYNHVENFIKEVLDNGFDISKKYNPKTKETVEYINNPCAFDIETTSINTKQGKTGFMYIWMFGINGISIYGRTWEEFVELVDTLSDVLKLSSKRLLVCYIHNEEFEFQFMREYFKWNNIFAIKERRPIYAITDNGVEFRCSYMLTGTKLETVGKDLLKYKVSKKVGDLDYSKTRHFATPLSEEELGYCINDIRVVMCKIKECIEEEGSITNIPLTKTGYVRRDVRKAMQKSRKDIEYVQNLKLTTSEYEMLLKAFQGGFTHANAYRSGQTLEDVVSYDFTSSYPCVMLSEMYPMSNGVEVEIHDKSEFMEYLRTHCCLFEIVMEDVRLKKDSGDAPISSSKCEIRGKKVIDNGRVRRADLLITTITEQDFFTYSQFYKFDYYIGKMIVYEKGYLPKPIIEKVLDYYEVKTTLKNVPSKEREYTMKKANLDSIYGMMVMLIVRPEICFNCNWYTQNPNMDEALSRYNDGRNRFNWFPWGVWITAYARRNLFTGIYECGVDDYIYSDTDSIKILNASDHDDYIASYNRQITEKLESCLDHYKIDKNRICPKTIKGKSKPLGVWDFDGHYTRFKTLGAKRYMVEHDDKWIEEQKECGEDYNPIATTIAGVSKKSGKKYFSQFKNPFEHFEENVEISADQTGKLTHTYCDYEITTEVTDYLGNTETINIKSGIYLEPAPFSMKISPAYSDLLYYIGIGEEEILFK